LKLMAVHGGGYLPGYSGRIDHAWGARQDSHGDLPLPPTTYLRQVYLDTVVFTYHQLAYLIDVFGPDRIVMGTDYPFDMAEYNPIGHIAGCMGWTKRRWRRSQAATRQGCWGWMYRFLIEAVAADAVSSLAPLFRGRGKKLNAPFCRLVPGLLIRMRGRKRRQLEAMLGQLRHAGNHPARVLRTARSPPARDADIRKPRLGAKRKRRGRALREQPLVGRKPLGGPVPAPLLDRVCIGPECLGEMIANARRHQRCASATVTSASDFA